MCGEWTLAVHIDRYCTIAGSLVIARGSVINVLSLDSIASRNIEDMYNFLSPLALGRICD